MKFIINQGESKQIYGDLEKVLNFSKIISTKRIYFKIYVFIRVVEAIIAVIETTSTYAINIYQNFNC
jgi:hypothetical protein